MQYQNIAPAIFLSRPNRFIANVLVEGSAQVAHVKNTGRCRELLLPGAAVWLEKSENPVRKTLWDLVAVEKQIPGGKLLINMDSQAPNCVVGEALANGQPIPGLPFPVRSFRREYTYGASRLDFLLETDGGQVLLEVKGVTLEEDGAALFPDAPTLRGVKHLEELSAAVGKGLGAAVLFVVQMGGMKQFSPNDRTHPAFGDALREAKAAGVIVSAVGCRVEPDGLWLEDAVPVEL
ncbi:MAG: DNA/RNA nuclease SfsA [Oscillospiraceae bacterium]